MREFSLYPAIDLKNGECVRLERGDMTRSTVYCTDPRAQAEEFVASGFSRLHVVDLDGAVSGESVNHAAVSRILSHVSVPVQLGGGIRSEDRIAMWLDAGVSRVVLGTAAVGDPSLVERAASRWPNQIAIGLDLRDGKVATEGWVNQTGVAASDMIARFGDFDIFGFIVTDISRDGMLSGPNLGQLAQLAASSRVPIIASGGIRNVADLIQLRDLRIDGASNDNNAIAGAIIGRALYDGTVDRVAAVKEMQG